MQNGIGWGNSRTSNAKRVLIESGMVKKIDQRTEKGHLQSPHWQINDYPFVGE